MEEHNSWKHKKKQIKFWRRKAFKVKKKKKKSKSIYLWRLLLIEKLCIHRGHYFVWKQKKGLWTSKAAGLTVVLEEWVAEKKRNTGGQVADNGDETPSKLCSSQQSSECFTSITWVFLIKTNPSPLRLDTLSGLEGHRRKIIHYILEMSSNSGAYYLL